MRSRSRRARTKRPGLPMMTSPNREGEIDFRAPRWCHRRRCQRLGLANACPCRQSTTRAFPSRGGIRWALRGNIAVSSASRTIAKWAVSLSLANRHASLPVAYRLYLPQEWASDCARRRKAGVPEDAVFKTKPEIALDQLRWAHAAGLPRGVVLLDAGYGNNSELRADITALGLTYAAGILSTTTVWAPGTRPLPAKTWSGRGRPPKLMRRDDKHRPVSVKALALSLPKQPWRTIKWREGAAEPLCSRFARLRVRVAHRDYWLAESRPEEWLLIEWPKGESEPTKYWLSTLPQDTPFVIWSTSPNCAGASSATTRSSSRKSGLDISKAGVGGASTTTPRCASQPTDS